MRKLARVVNQRADARSPQGFLCGRLGPSQNARGSTGQHGAVAQAGYDGRQRFCAGFDGMLAGYLLLDGKKALEVIDQRFLNNPRAAQGDVLHALTALRFYAESGSDISSELASALRHLLQRPEFPDRVITDLARWQDWSDVEQIAALYSTDAQTTVVASRSRWLSAGLSHQASRRRTGEVASHGSTGSGGCALETLTKLGGSD